MNKITPSEDGPKKAISWGVRIFAISFIALITASLLLPNLAGGLHSNYPYREFKSNLRQIAIASIAYHMEYKQPPLNLDQLLRWIDQESPTISAKLVRNPFNPEQTIPITYFPQAHAASEDAVLLYAYWEQKREYLIINASGTASRSKTQPIGANNF